MSKVHRMARVTSVESARGRASKRGRYDAWSRQESDFLKKEILRTLGHNTEEFDPSTKYCGYDYLSRLASVAWDSDPLSQLPLAQARALFSKDEDLASPVDKELAGFQSFELSERSCRSINDAFLERELGGHPFPPDVESILHYSRRKIARILGDAPLLADLHLSFGPGATVTCRKKTSARYKLSTPPSIGKPALDIVMQLVKHVPRWYEAFGVVHVSPGVLEFVPKNYLTYRAIVLPPTLTGMAQRAVGSEMKVKLLRGGINLREQSINRERARLASRNDGDATVDLSRASDSVAYRLVEDQFPLPWFELFDCLRDDRVRYGDKVIHLEKFSSMGNGYTFELESVLFYGLCYGIARHYGLPTDGITVYGDDIVVPQPLARYIFEIFPILGFEVNQAKSFTEGVFRESCGGDYVLGIDVRPFFVKDRMTHHTVVCFYNHLTRKAHQDPDRKLRELLLAWLPERYRNFGPDGYGDGHLISNAPIQTYADRHARGKGYSGFTFKTFVEIPIRDETPVVGDALLPFYVMHLRAIREEDGWADDESFQSYFRWGAQVLRSQYRDAFLRSYLESLDSPLDHYVLRKEKNARVRGKGIRVYVLDAGL